jgi:hypothetical protein
MVLPPLRQRPLGEPEVIPATGFSEFWKRALNMAPRFPRLNAQQSDKRPQRSAQAVARFRYQEIYLLKFTKNASDHKQILL